MKLLEGKTALITGANRGIGKAIAKCFAKHGGQIAFSDIAYDDSSRSLEEELRGMGRRLRHFGREQHRDAQAFELGRGDDLEAPTDADQLEPLAARTDLLDV